MSKNSGDSLRASFRYLFILLETCVNTVAASSCVGDVGKITFSGL